MNITFVGDFMLSGDQDGKPILVSPKLNRLLSKADFRVATLETAVGQYDDIDDFKRQKNEVAVWSKSDDLQKLLDLNINVVSLANNHACDCGVDTMLQLMENLREKGITPIGAGCNAEEAMKPAVFEKDGETLAIVGCCEDNPNALGTLHYATEYGGGIFRLDENYIIPYIKELKRKFNYVAIVVHWGVEHKWLPEQYDVNIGKKMIEAGADAIIGGHPHHIQPMIIYQGRPVCYSLGNFYFPNFCLDTVSNVYYPDPNELSQLPIFDWMAPGQRNFKMRYFWKYYGRLGMVASMNFNKDHVGYAKSFSIYNNGKLTLSNVGLYHTSTLKVFSHYVGKESSRKINNNITRIKNILEYKILALFCRRYRFFKYMKTNNK